MTAWKRARWPRPRGVPPWAACEGWTAGRFVMVKAREGAGARPAPASKAAASAARGALAEAVRGLPRGRAGGVCVTFVDKVEMSSLNVHVAGARRPTDVLTFPSVVPGVLGDLFVCLPYVMEALGCRSRSSARLATRVRRLVVHGVAHLAGAEHYTRPDFARMRRLEARMGRGIPSLRARDAPLRP